MAQITIPQSVANASKDSALYKLLKLVNAQAAAINTLTAKLDADAGVGDANYAATLGTMDTGKFDVDGVPA